MKKLLFVTLVVAVIALAMAVPAFASDEDGAVHCESGKTFGLHHAGMAESGMFDGDTNPGVLHVGYSHCLELGEG